MNKLNKILLIAVPVFALSLNANAHDPKMHKKTAEKADCSKMADMKHDGKMNMKDPVMMAMMKKCMNKKHMDMEDKKGMDMKNMKGMDMKNMKGMDMKNMKGMDMKNMKGMDMKNMKHEKSESGHTEHEHH